MYGWMYHDTHAIQLKLIVNWNVYKSYGSITFTKQFVCLVPNFKSIHCKIFYGLLWQARKKSKYGVVVKEVVNATYLGTQRAYRKELNGKFIDEFLSNYDEVHTLQM